MKSTLLSMLSLVLVQINASHYKPMCPDNEIYQPCEPMEELPCWTGPDKKHRIYKNPMKMSNCKPMCVCRNNFVREFTGGKCIKAYKCRNLLTNPLADSASQEDYVSGQDYKFDENHKFGEY